MLINNKNIYFGGRYDTWAGGRLFMFRYQLYFTTSSYILFLVMVITTLRHFFFLLTLFAGSALILANRQVLRFLFVAENECQSQYLLSMLVRFIWRRILFVAVNVYVGCLVRLLWFDFNPYLRLKNKNSNKWDENDFVCMFTYT